MSQGLIFKKILSVMSEIDAIAKSRDNKAQGFKFRGIDDIYNELHPKMAKAGVFTVPEVLEERREERQTAKGGTMTYVILKIKFTFYAEDGSSVSAIMVGEGADSGDKASNKAQAIAHKYVLLQVFAIPTEDAKDPDAESPEFKPKPKAVKNTTSPEVAPQAKGETEMSDPGDYRFDWGTADKGYRGMTLREAVERDGGSAVEMYLHRLIKQCEDNDKRPWHGLIMASNRLEEYKRMVTSSNRTRERLDFESGDFDDSAFDAAKAAK